MLEYDSWKKELKETERSLNYLPNAPETQELQKVYGRICVIIEEILSDLAPQLDDPQYCGTTSWSYEKELKELREKKDELEPIIEEILQQREHQEMLDDIGWTQEQWDANEKEVAEQAKLVRAARIKKKIGKQ